jgi:hypothetical protein
MDMYDNTYVALNLLIDNLEAIQDDLRSPHCHYDNYRIDSPMGWAKEFCTVRLASARRSGHTSAIMRTIERRFSSRGADVLLILPHERMKKHVIDNFHPDEERVKLFAASDLHADFSPLDGLSADAIFVDCAFWLTDNMEQVIYEQGLHILGRRPVGYFIFVQ